MLPGDEVTAYCVIAEPLFAGAVKVTVAEVFPGVADGELGIPGMVAGVTAGLVALLGDEVPMALAATTVKVYAVPLVRPVTMIGDDAPYPTNPPGDEVTAYWVMALPPVAPAANVTVEVALPGVAVPMVGGDGTVAGVTGLDEAEAADGPMAFVATTTNVYACPFVNPVMRWENPVPPALVSVPPLDE